MVASGIYISFYTTTGNRGYDYLLSSNSFVQLLMASDYMILTDTHRELKKTAQKGSVADLSFTERLKWAVNLYCSPRGVGWVHERRLTMLPVQSRREFLFKKTVSTLGKFIIFDTFTYLNKIYPPYQEHEHWLLWRCLNFLALVVPASSFIDMVYGFASIIAVGTYVSEPEEWPPLFGKWLDAYTVRRLWNRTWHQLLRRPFVTYGRFLAYKVFRLQRGSIPSGIVQLFTAFIISGFIHQMADYSMLGNLFEGGSFKFFILQPFAILFEETVIYLAGKMQINPCPTVSRCIGYLWVVSWFTFCVPIMQIPMIRGGISTIGPDLHLVQYVVSR